LDNIIFGFGCVNQRIFGRHAVAAEGPQRQMCEAKRELLPFAAQRDDGTRPKKDFERNESQHECFKEVFYGSAIH
jgi:hypothetical protein